MCKKKLQKSRYKYYSFQMILMFLYNTLKATTVSNSSIRHCSFLYKLCLRHIHIVRSFMRSCACLETVSMYYGYNSLSTLPAYLYKARLRDSKLSNSHLEDKLGQLHEPTPNPNTISLNTERIFLFYTAKTLKPNSSFPLPEELYIWYSLSFT